MEEPSMLKQRPSSSHTQDTSHIIMSTFRDLFSQGGMRQDLIENLSVSKGGENVYHDKYVEKLQNIHERWATKITAIDDMIQHLDKAKAQARILELQEEAKAKKEYAFYQDLGLPSVPSRLNHFLNCKRLRENGLVVPNEFLDYKSEPIAIEESVEQAIPQYASSTFSSRQQFDKLPKDDNYLPKPEPILPKLSKVGSEDTKIQTRKSQALASRSEKNVWRKCLPPKQREDEKKEIMKLQQRADFLKNPRFLPDPRSLVKTFKKDAVATIRHEESYFQANPHPVLFNGYEVGFSYQLKLELKNITAASRQLRLIEPKTNYFSLKMGDFPSTNGLVAPGMSCTFTIQFTPETLEDYNDQIEVKTMGEGSLVIPLQGRRKPPILNLPDEINCGHCLVGDVKTKDFVIQNTGGLGRFCFINADEVNTTQIDWDQLNYDSEEGLLMTNFIISPRIFSLQENESVIIKVVFSPEGVKSFLSGIVLLCDNCVKNSHHIIGIGEVADIELISVEGGLHEPILGETQDLQAEQIVRFQECYPDVVYTKTLLIKNRIPVPMDYEWIISPPQVTSNALTINSGDAIETSSPFHIHPSSGVLDEEAEQCFQIIFSPTSIDHWFNVATFSMKNIPVKNEEEEDKYFYQNQDFLQISIKGQTQPYNVKVEPGFVALSGRNFCGITYYKTVTLVNKSGSCASFQWQNVDTVRCSVACDPSNGSIDGNSSMEFLVAITGKKEGRVDVEIPYHVQSSVTDSRLHLQAHFVGADIQIEGNDTNFGLIRLGDCVEREVTLVNTSPIEARWKISYTSYQDPDSEYLQITPNEGVLGANSEETINLRFCPKEEVTFTGHLTCDVADSKPCYQSIFGEAQRANVYAESSHVNIETSFIDCPLAVEVTLCNAGLLPATCRFKPCSSENVEIAYEVEEFTLEAHQKLTTKLFLTYRKMGELDTYIACLVEDMLDPVVFELSTDVQGLIVDVTVPNLKDIENQSETVRNNDVIEFGQSVVLGQKANALVVIENRSEISTTFDLSFQEFQSSRLPSPPEGTRKKEKRSNLGRMLHKSSPAFRSKTDLQIQKEYSESTLKSGRGLALMCQPWYGSLSAYERKIVTVSCQSDVWGDYNDLLHCQIGDSIEKVIPVRVNIIGTPLTFQMTNEYPPIVRFGTHPSAGSVVKRSLRINNKSYVDIRLDWDTFIVDDDDDQLIDLDCFYGNPFPILDQDGNEVVEEEEKEEGDLVRVVLKEHEGRKSTQPFKVLNKQMVVPGQGHASLEISFTPPQQVREEESYLGFTMGHISLKQKDKNGENGCYIRADGLDMLPFGVNMTACVQPPKMILEACDEEEFLFELKATELLDPGTCALREKVSLSRRFVLSNRSGTTITFGCRINEPFEMAVTKDKMAAHSKKGKTEKSKFTLKPNQNLEFRVWLHMTPVLVKKNAIDEKMVTLTEDLIVSFDDKGVQSYPMTCLIHYPILELPQKLIDFGVCFVGQRRELMLKITNSSKALLYWKIAIDKTCSQTARDVFKLDTSTFCHSNKTNSFIEAEHSDEVIIQFLAKHNIEYECRVIVTSIFHELFLKSKGSVITVRGQGSYDEGTRE